MLGPPRTNSLGIKHMLKTVVTGVDWSSGAARDAVDPCLETAGGTRVPFMSCDKAYKHLGILWGIPGFPSIGCRVTCSKKLLA